MEGAESKDVGQDIKTQDVSEDGYFSLSTNPTPEVSGGRSQKQISRTSSASGSICQCPNQSHLCSHASLNSDETGNANNHGYSSTGSSISSGMEKYTSHGGSRGRPGPLQHSASITTVKKSTPPLERHKKARKENRSNSQSPPAKSRGSSKGSSNKSSMNNTLQNVEFELGDHVSDNGVCIQDSTFPPNYLQQEELYEDQRKVTPSTSESLTSKSSSSSVKSKDINGSWEDKEGVKAMSHSASASTFDHATSVDYSAGVGVHQSSSFSSLQQQRRKKSPWYNALYPSYKSRSDDFKKIFNKLPEGERLIVEYSCALQKDILVHGRLYVSKNYLCFYSNIFRWETCLRLKWKGIKNICKEKTALVIPNAIEIFTSKDERYFFTSFLARDRAFMMLFKLWQNALLDQPASSADIWKWIHSEYGDELGLTSEDEHDYYGPFAIHRPTNLTRNQSSESSKGKIPSITEETAGNQMGDDGEFRSSSRADGVEPHALEGFSDSENLSHSGGIQEEMVDASAGQDGDGESAGIKHQLVEASDLSEASSDLDADAPDSLSSRKRIKKIKKPKTEGVSKIPIQVGVNEVDISVALEAWRSNEEGRELMNQIFPISVDDLFNQIFSGSDFFMKYHASRKTFDIELGDWKSKPDSGDQVRDVSFTLSLTHPMGPKHSQVTETQTMREGSKPGQIYFIDVVAVNGGIPYADSFYVKNCFCISRCSPDRDSDYIPDAKNCSRLTLISSIKYKKTVWGLVKTFIEKNTWAGLDDFYASLTKALQEEYQPLGGVSAKETSKSRQKKLRGAKNRGHSANVGGQRGREGNLRADDLGDGSLTNKKGNLLADLSHKQSPNLSSISKRLHQQSSTSWLNEILVKFIVLLLTCLLVTNSVLFYKLWDLETRVLQPKRESYVRHQDLNFEELFKVGDIPQGEDKKPPTNIDWLKILHRQEVMHQIELEKWHTLLGSATELLRQTEQSLTNLQKSIHPLALQKIRGLMYLQHQDWENLLDQTMENHEPKQQQAENPPVNSLRNNEMAASKHDEN